MPAQTKLDLCANRRADHTALFVDRARRLRARHAVPFAAGYCLPSPEQWWMNDINNINSPAQAKAALEAARPAAHDGKPIACLDMNPGDRWDPERGLERDAPPPTGRGTSKRCASMPRRSLPPSRPCGRARKTPSRGSTRDSSSGSESSSPSDGSWPSKPTFGSRSMCAAARVSSGSSTRRRGRRSLGSGGSPSRTSRSGSRARCSTRCSRGGSRGTKS